VNKEMHTDIFCHLEDAIRRKHPKKTENQQFFSLLHDNAPAHQSVLVKDFVAKNNVITQEHLPYSPDLAAADFYLFPRLKLT